MPNPLARLYAGLKSMVYAGGATLPGTTARELARRDGWGISYIPVDGSRNVRGIGGDPDAQRAGPTWENSAVAIGLNWVSDQFPRADLLVEGRADGDSWAAVRDDPMVALLDDPTPEHGAYDFPGLWAGALLSCLCDGNGYWIKARDGTGGVRELWWAPHDSMRPFRADPRSPDYKYLYTVRLPGVAEPVVTVFEPSEVVHFKHGPPDPLNDLKAMAPLRRCYKEVASDNEVSAYTSGVLFNRGVPGLIAVFDSEVNISQERADEIKESIRRAFTGRNLNEISRIPEARICAALGIPAAVLGLSVGETQKTYANYESAERQAWRRLRAVQDRMAEALYRQLLPDFRPDRADFRVVWDYSRVEALQDDRDATAKRAVLLFQGGVAMRSEARSMIGLPAAEGGADDVYFAGKVANPDGTDPAAQPAAGPPPDPIGDRAAKLMDRIEADYDAALRPALPRLGGGPGDAGDPAQGGDRPGGGPGPAARQPAWPAEWDSDRQGAEEDLPGDGVGNPGLAGGPGFPGDPGGDPAV
jgi:phage portal protein BeeE